MTRPAKVIISITNLCHNLEVIKKLVPTAKIVPMIKANAYGHGLLQISQALDQKIYGFGVCSIEEAVHLRENGVKSNIIITQGIYEKEELLTASQYNIEIVFHNFTQLQWLIQSTIPNPIQSWIKINTGLGRLGFQMEEIDKAYDILKKSVNVIPLPKIMSHFACADKIHHPLNIKQISQFEKAIKLLDPQRLTQYSLCNSAAIINFPECQYDFVRPGIMIYGAGEFASKLGLKPVMTAKSAIMSVKKIKSGESIGYGALSYLEKDTVIGVIPFGYADGYPLNARDGTQILVKGIPCPLIGRVSMDMITVDLSLHPDYVEVGDEAVLWGEGMHLQKLCNSANTIPWEVMTSVQGRVKYVYQ